MGESKVAELHGGDQGRTPESQREQGEGSGREKCDNISSFNLYISSTEIGIIPITQKKKLRLIEVNLPKII